VQVPAPLPRAWYARRPVDVARDLVGMVLVREIEDEFLAGVIVEVEAYLGRADRASHARAGITPRTRSMFGPPGHAYVYRLYGMHWAFNVVAHSEDEEAGAVLVRAALPLLGGASQRRRRNRPDDPDWRLASGPGRLCQALAITGRDDGHDLTAGRGLWIGIESSLAPETSAQTDETSTARGRRAETGARCRGDAASRRLLVGPRVNVDHAREWAAMPFRFGLAGSAALSRPFPGMSQAVSARRRPSPGASASR